MKQECGSCRFFFGQSCRKSAPIAGDPVGGCPHPVWPFMDAMDWCGDWKQTENQHTIDLYERTYPKKEKKHLHWTSMTGWSKASFLTAELPVDRKTLTIYIDMQELKKHRNLAVVIPRKHYGEIDENILGVVHEALNLVNEEGGP